MAALLGVPVGKVVGVVECYGGVGRDVLGQHQGLYEVGGRGGYRARVRTFLYIGWGCLRSTPPGMPPRGR